MGRTRQDIGKLGEKIAKRFLLSRGFRILNKNFLTPFGEIDLVTEKDDCIVFLEVKTRISERFGPPLSAITKTKQRHIIKNCLYYLKKHGSYEKLWRIDAIGINLSRDKRLEVLNHVRNAVEM